ncbi:MAG: hypothetical protein RLY65_1821, partial [Pseudomonadota bacterium]
MTQHAKAPSIPSSVEHGKGLG